MLKFRSIALAAAAVAVFPFVCLGADLSQLEKSVLSGDNSASADAVVQLCALSDSQAGPLLIKALSSPGVQARKKALACLGNSKNREALPSVVKMTKDSNTVISGAAFEALSAYDDMSAVGALREIVYSNEDFEYRKKAASAIGAMKKAEIARVFIEDAKNPDRRVADRAAMVLVHLRMPGAVRPLAEAAKSDNPVLRQAALDALSASAEPDAEKIYVELVNDAQAGSAVRLSAAKSLAVIASTSAMAALESFAGNEKEDPALRAEVKKLYKSASSMGIMKYLSFFLIGIILLGFWWMQKQGANF
ncbi:MAG: HEAT repeat domain-containing protein [Elusimicrobiaceae bacterium]